MRRSVLVLLALLIVLGGAWTGLWVYGSREAGRQLDAWIAAEAAQGRDWTCPDRQTGGYPFALRITCRGPTFAGRALGARVEASLAALEGGTSLLHPTRVALKLTPPFVYRSADRAVDVRGQWSALQVDLDGLPAVSRIVLEGTDLVVAGSFGPAGRQSWPAARLAATLVPPPGPSDPLAFDLAVFGIDVPAIDELIGDSTPADVAFRGTIDHTDIGEARTPEEAMERWRVAGGRLRLAAASITRGSSVASASGLLALDPAHRATGHLDAELYGLEPILQRYGLDPKLVAAGGLLSHLLGAGGAKPPTRPGAIALPVNLRDGFLSVGPLRTSVALLPLY